MATKKSTAKKKKNIKLAYGLLHVQTTPNNTIVTLTDENGNKVLGGGTGLVGYKGSKQSTPYAAEVLTKEILSEAKNYGLNQIAIIFKGTGLSRDGVFKAVNDLGGIDITFIKEATPIQFGGCKGKRQRRI
jgi:small subunit ribosomal protein S11